LVQPLQMFLPEGHISYYTTLRGPDLLRNVIVTEYVIFNHISKCFVNIFFCHYWQNLCGRMKMASRAGWNGLTGWIWSAGRRLETPGLVLLEDSIHSLSTAFLQSSAMKFDCWCDFS